MNKKLEEILLKHGYECYNEDDDGVLYCDDRTYSDDCPMVKFIKQAFAAGQSEAVQFHHFNHNESCQFCKQWHEALVERAEQNGRQEVFDWLKERTAHWKGDAKALLDMLLKQIEEKFGVK